MALPANIDTMLKGLQLTHRTVKTTEGDAGAMYLRLLRSGEFAYGPEGTEVEPGSHWAVSPQSFAHGYVCWDSNAKSATKLGEVMRPAYEPPIPQSELPDTGQAWDQQLGCGMICLDGEDKGTKVVYTTTSKGGVRAVNDLMGKFIERIQAGHDDEIVPVITLDTDSYQHKKYGTVYVPSLSIVRWASLDATADDTAKEVAKDEEEKAEEDTGGTRRRKRRVRAA